MTVILTYVIIFILVLIFFSGINYYNTQNEPTNYILRSLYHANIEHLAINMFSLYNLSYVETAVGRTQFVFAIVFIWLVSSLLLYFIHIIFPSRKVYTVGFSGVIFGLAVVFYSLLGETTTITLTRLLVGIIPQFFMQGISFEGHLSGIIAGVLYVIFFEKTISNNSINNLANSIQYI